jgi:uncharacterized protein YlxP (DUF503 family)
MASIGVLTLELVLPDAHSLKEKRHVVQSLKDRLRHKFNVSVAEIDHQDTWQRATLAVACVSNDARLANEVVSKAVNYIESLSDGQGVRRSVECPPA